MDQDKARRMRVQWKKARNMYGSFFAELGEVRKEIGDENLAQWCKHPLGIHIDLSLIRSATRLLWGLDAKRERDALAPAIKAEKDAKAAAGIRCERVKRNDNEKGSVPPPLPKTAEELLALRKRPCRNDNENDVATKSENARLRARVTELEEQLARETKRNETKPKGNGGRPCKGDRPMTGYERLKAFRERQRSNSTA